MDNQLKEKLILLQRVLAQAAQPPDYFSNGNNLSITVAKDRYAGITAELTAAGIPFQPLSDQEFSIKLSLPTPATEVFFQETHFRQRIKSFLPLAKDLALLDFHGSWLHYDHQAAVTTTESGAVPGHHLLDNATAWYTAFDMLTDEKFADYVNTLNKEIVLYSSTKGIKRINYPDYVPVFDPSTDLSPGVNTLKRRLESADFSIYFKNELFAFTPTNPDAELKEILIAMPALIRSADNNLQLYLKNFSFEKLKSDLLKEKDKYFAALREILGKNLNQIVGIPVSFAAAVFATYKVNDAFILLIILGAFLIYSGFTYYLQSLYLGDIKEIEADFQRDFRQLADRSGLPADTIDAEKAKIERRIRDIRAVILRFRLLLVVLSIVFGVFIGYQLIGVTAAGWHFFGLLLTRK